MTSHVSSSLLFFAFLMRFTAFLVLMWQKCSFVFFPRYSACVIAISSDSGGRMMLGVRGSLLFSYFLFSFWLVSSSSAWRHAIAPSPLISDRAFSRSSPLTASLPPSAMNISPKEVTPIRHNSLSRPIFSPQAPPLSPKSIMDMFLASTSLRLKTLLLSTGGSVFGWSITVVIPPAAAAHDPVYQSSFIRSPMPRKCT